MDFIRYVLRLKLLTFIKKWNLINLLLGIIDVFAILIAFQVAYFLNYSERGILFFNEKEFLILFGGILPFWLITQYLIKNTEIPRTKPYLLLFFEYMQSAIIMLALLIISLLVFNINFASPLFQIELIVIGFLLLFAVRLMEYKLFRIIRSKGYNQVNVVLIADETSLSFIDNLLHKREWGYRIIAIFSGSKVLSEKYEKNIIILPEENLMILNDLIKGDIVDEVLYIKSKVVPLEVRKIISACEELGVIFRLRYDKKKKILTNAFKAKIANTSFLNFVNTPNNPYALSLKIVLDVYISLFLLIMLTPLLIIISALVKFSSPGPIIYKQQRVGLRGRKFTLYKFRTMILNADTIRQDLDADNEADGPAFKIKDDPRVTKIGKFLRKTGFDELPQLINILKGEMSLIGPRPPLESETFQYKSWQLRRLSVKPGLSCFWQTKSDRNNIKFEKWMELDLAYIDNWSPRLDIMIFIKTIRTVFQRGGM